MELKAEMFWTRAGKYVEVTLSNKKRIIISDGAVKACAKELSDDELKKVLSDCKRQLKNMGKNKIPFSFSPMEIQIKNEITDRKIKFH